MAMPIMSEVNTYAKPLTMNVPSTTTKVDHPMHGPPMASGTMMPLPHPYLEHTSRPSLMAKGSGADRDVISKLKNTIEEKQHQRLIKKQTSMEGLTEDGNKGDIASILAARIRTKGELKGYIAPPTEPQFGDADQSRMVDNKAPAPLNINPKERFDPPPDMEGVAALVMGDWGSACNDFVQQLQTGKKKPKRRRVPKSEDSTRIKQEKPDESDVIHEDPSMSVVPKEAIRDADKLLMPNKATVSDGSSDEDKPLVLIRQQSLNEKAKVTESDVTSRSSSVLTIGRMFDRVTGSPVVKGVKEKRLLQEKRYAARIANASSSESETENKKKPLKPFKRKKVLLKQSSSMARKANSRGSESSQEDEEDDEDQRSEKRKSAKSPAASSTKGQETPIANTPNRKRGKSKVTESSDSEQEVTAPTPPKKKSGALTSNKSIESIKPTPVSVPAKDKPKSDTSDDDASKRNRKGPKKTPAKATGKEKVQNDSSDESSGKEVDKKKSLSANNKKSKNAVAAKSLSDAESKARRSKESSTPTRTTKSGCNKSTDVGPKKSSATKEPKAKSKREEPMTRSKKKQEIAEQKANSLVLRNDKVIQSPSSKAAAKLNAPNKVGGLKRKVSDVGVAKVKKGAKETKDSKPVASSSSSDEKDEEVASDSSDSDDSESCAETAVSVR